MRAMERQLNLTTVRISTAPRACSEIDPAGRYRDQAGKRGIKSEWRENWVPEKDVACESISVVSTSTLLSSFVALKAYLQFTLMRGIRRETHQAKYRKRSTDVERLTCLDEPIVDAACVSSLR